MTENKPYRYKPDDWVEERTGEALQRYNTIKLMLQESKIALKAATTTLTVEQMYDQIFNYFADRLYDDHTCKHPLVGVSKEYVFWSQDQFAWTDVLHHKGPMPFTEEIPKSWTVAERTAKPWSARVGTYFYNIVNIDDDGANFEGPDGIHIHEHYILKDGVGPNSSSGEQARREKDETAKATAEKVKADAEAKTASAQAELAQQQLTEQQHKTATAASEAREAEAKAAKADKETEEAASILQEHKLKALAAERCPQFKDLQNLEADIAKKTEELKSLDLHIETRQDIIRELKVSLAQFFNTTRSEETRRRT